MGIVTTSKELMTPKTPEKKKVEDNQAIQASISKAVDKHIASGIKKRDKVIDAFSPSNTNMCPRYAVYLFRDGEEPDPDHDARVQRIFDTGHAMHERVCGYFKDMDILLEEEFPVVWDSPPIKGTCDGIIDWDGRKLIELKSINDSGFMTRKLYGKPKDEHARQAQIYMKCLDLDSGFVIYENKNNQELLFLLVQRDETYIKKLFKKYDTIWSAFQAGILPERPYVETSDKCKYCKLKARCWSDDEVSQKI